MRGAGANRERVPCCEGLDRDEIEFLNQIKPELKSLAEKYSKPEVARRFGVSIDHDRPRLPPGKVWVQPRRPKAVDVQHLSAFGNCYCCEVDWITGECIRYCCDGDEKKWEGLMWAGLGAAIALLGGELLRRRRT